MPSRGSLRLYRGLPGSGKTIAALVAREATPRTVQLESVDPFGIDYGARYEVGRLDRSCARVQSALLEGIDVYVHACFLTTKEMIPYLRLARDAGARCEIVDLYDAGMSDEQLVDRCIHNVPLSVIRWARTRYDRIKSGQEGLE